MVMGSVTTVLITGITGTVGVALAQHLSTIPNVEIHGLKRIRSDTKLLLSLAGKITLHEGDMTDAHTMMRLIKKIRPDRVYHLAAQSYPSESWNSANFTLRTNIEGTTNLLEALKEYAPNCRTHIAGSSAQYGKLHPHEIPVKENHPMSPVSPYGVSKVTQELLGRQYFLSYNMFVVVTRSFNLIGPQGERCAVQGWCKQVAMIEAGLQPPVVMVGDLSPQRDFTHVRDVAEALWLLLERGVAGGVYNLCTGKATQMQSVLNMIISQSVLKDSIKYEVDPALLRPVEEPILTGDVTAIKNAIGWEAKIGIQEMVKEILDYWRGRISVCGTL